MERLTLLMFSVACVLLSSSQVARQNEVFKDVTIINNKVAFVKEVSLQNISGEQAYLKMKEWAIENYGEDPFISSIRYEDKKQDIVAKSRIELILPEDSKGVREKMVMRYRIDCFIYEDKCILEVTELSFLCDNAKEMKLSRFIRAEEFITDRMIESKDELQELRVNTKKSTLYFINSLGKEFEALFGY